MSQNPPSIDDLIKHAEDRKASDIHIAVGDVVYLRIDGHLVAEDEMPVVTEEYVDRVLKTLLTLEQIEELKNILKQTFDHEDNHKCVHHYHHRCSHSNCSCGH